MTATTGDAEAVIAAALASAKPTALEDDLRYAVVVPLGGRVEVLDVVDESALAAPRRVRGTTTVLDVDSFSVLYGKHAENHAELYADETAGTFTAVLNADSGIEADAGWRDHRLVLRCAKTPAWLAWERIDGRLLSQEQFAEFIEERSVDVVAPTGAEMLELALTFQATTKAEFTGVLSPSSGTRQITFAETATAKAGQKGSIEIPAIIDLGLRPFEASEAYRVRARFRYRVRDGVLQLGVKLERPEDVLREAFGDLSAAVNEATGAIVLRGYAPEAR